MALGVSGGGAGVEEFCDIDASKARILIQKLAICA